MTQKQHRSLILRWWTLQNYYVLIAQDLKLWIFGVGFNTPYFMFLQHISTFLKFTCFYFPHKIKIVVDPQVCDSGPSWWWWLFLIVMSTHCIHVSCLLAYMGREGLVCSYIASWRHRYTQSKTSQIAFCFQFLPSTAALQIKFTRSNLLRMIRTATCKCSI